MCRTTGKNFDRSATNKLPGRLREAPTMKRLGNKTSTGLPVVVHPSTTNTCKTSTNEFASGLAPPESEYWRPEHEYAPPLPRHDWHQSVVSITPSCCLLVDFSSSLVRGQPMRPNSSRSIGHHSQWAQNFSPLSSPEQYRCARPHGSRSLVTVYFSSMQSIFFASNSLEISQSPRSFSTGSHLSGVQSLMEPILAGSTSNAGNRYVVPCAEAGADADLCFATCSTEMSSHSYCSGRR